VNNERRQACALHGETPGPEIPGGSHARETGARVGQRPAVERLGRLGSQ